MDAKFPRPEPPPPVTTVLDFDDGNSALVTTFDQTIIVNWTPWMNPRDFAELVVTETGQSDVAFMTQYPGEPIKDLGSLRIESVLDYDQFGIDSSLYFLRIDLSETQTAAWQVVDQDTAYAGLGDDALQFDADLLHRLIERSTSKQFDTEAILAAVRRAREQLGGSAGSPAHSGA